MKISVVPASTQAGKATIESLLKQPNPLQIRAIYRNRSKAPANFTTHPNFDAVQGGLDEGLDLDFVDSDAVFYVPPPTYDDAVDSGEHATRTANRVKEALEKATRVKRLVLLSALGAQHADGIGILKINHITDNTLTNSVPEVVIARPGWFFENWAEALETANGEPSFFETHFTPEDHEIVMISLADVGKIVADNLMNAGKPLPSSPRVLGLHGPRNYSMLDLQAALQQVTGKKARIDGVDPHRLVDLFKEKLPPIKAEEVTEMTLAINGGGLLAGEMASPERTMEAVVRGKTELVETLRLLDSGEVSKVASGAF